MSELETRVKYLEHIADDLLNKVNHMTKSSKGKKATAESSEAPAVAPVSSTPSADLIYPKCKVMYKGIVRMVDKSVLAEDPDLLSFMEANHPHCFKS